MQIHTNSVLQQHNINNESFTRQTFHSIRRWAPIQKGLRPDRPTQPETWRSPETLQEGKKHQQSVISLQSPTEACCHRRCSQHVLRLCLHQSWPGRRSSQRTVRRIRWNCLWFRLWLHIWVWLKGVNRKPFPQMALLRATQIFKKENPKTMSSKFPTFQPPSSNSDSVSSDEDLFFLSKSTHVSYNAN